MPLQPDVPSAGPDVQGTVQARVETLTLYPSSTSILGGDSQQFSFALSGVGELLGTVTWETDAGTISSNGLLTAPPAIIGTPQVFNVRVRSDDDPAVYTSATVSIPAGVQADLSKPVILSLIYQANNKLRAVFSEPINPSNPTGFDVVAGLSGSLSSIAISSIALVGNDTYDFTLASNLYAGDVIRLSYSPGNVVDRAAPTPNAMDAATYSAANQSAIYRPDITGLNVSPQNALVTLGGTLSIQYNVLGVGSFDDSVIVTLYGVGSVSDNGSGVVTYTAPSSGLTQGVTIRIASTQEPSVFHDVEILLSNSSGYTIGGGELLVRGPYTLLAESGKRSQVRCYKGDDFFIDCLCQANSAPVNLSGATITANLLDPQRNSVTFGGTNLTSTNGRCVVQNAAQGRVRLNVGGFAVSGQYSLTITRDNGTGDIQRFGTLYFLVEEA